jgi:hypothetical protein
MSTSERTSTDRADEVQPASIAPQRADGAVAAEPHGDRQPTGREPEPQAAHPHSPDRLAAYLLGPTVYCA